MGDRSYAIGRHVRVCRMLEERTVPCESIFTLLEGRHFGSEIRLDF